MGKTVWCEDSGSGYEFWKLIFRGIDKDITVESKKNISELVKAVKKLENTVNNYYIIADYAIDNPDVLRELNRLKSYSEGKENIKVLHFHSFEYILLSMDFLIDWIYALDDDLKEKRQEYIDYRRTFLDIDLYNNADNLEELKSLENGLECSNSEQIAAKLLSKLTKNTGFETDKKKLGVCFKDSCCGYAERTQEDLCGLDNNRKTIEEKIEVYIENSMIKSEFQKVGLL